MVKKATSTTKTKSKTTELKVLPGGQLNNFLNTLTDKALKLKTSKTFYILLIALGLALLFFFKKSWFVAAIVNGIPVTNLELQMRLNQQFADPTLTQLINEKIIMSEASKNNAVVSETEIDKKISEIEISVGGAKALDDILAQQGQNRTTIRQQIKLPLILEKLYSKEATVSAEEVTQFIEQNKDQLKATDSAGQQKEAYDGIKNQKATQIYSQKFQELSKNAIIQKF